MDIKEIVSLAGGPIKLGRSLGLSRGAVSQWKKVPADRVLALSAATGWKVTPHEMRPDIYPNPRDALPAGEVGAHVESAPAHPRAPTTFGEFGEPRSGTDRRQDGDRRDPASTFGEFGEPRDGDRRVEDRRKSSGPGEQA